MIHQLHLKKSWFVFAILLLAAGTVVGAIYAAGASEQTDQTLKEYLNGFFQALPEQNNQGSAFKTALRENVRLFLLIFLGGCFRFGMVLSMGSVVLKGFSAGFTTAAMIKYYGAKGLLINLCSLPATLLFIPIFIFYAAYSGEFSRKQKKWEEKRWLG